MTPTIITRRLASVIALLLLLAVLAVFRVSPARAATYSISIHGLAFDPPNLTVPPGSTVTWTNNETDGTVHSSTSDDGLWDSPDLSPGQSFSFTFDKAGTFNFHCRFHSYMTGTITVGSGSGDTTTTTAAPETTTTTAPPDTTTTTAPSDTTTTTAPPQSTTTTTAPSDPTTTSTTAPPATPSSTTTTTAAPPSGGGTVIGDQVIPPVDDAISQKVLPAFKTFWAAVDSILAILKGGAPS